MAMIFHTIGGILEAADVLSLLRLQDKVSGSSGFKSHNVLTGGKLNLTDRFLVIKNL